MQQIYINIKKQRQSLKMTQSELAQKLGYADKSMIAKIEKGLVDLPHSKIIAIAQILQTTPMMLTGWSDEPTLYQPSEIFHDLSDEEKQLLSQYQKLDHYGKKAVNTILDIEYDRCHEISKTPIYHSTILKPLYHSSLSAGLGSYVFDDVPTEQIEIDEKYQDIDFVIYVNGQSMEPTFYDGDKVMIKKGEVRIGDIGAFMIDGEAYIKERGKNGLISHNKDYDMISFHEGMRIDCIGKVVGKID